MNMQVLDKPSDLSLSGNLRKFRISSDSEIDFVLSKGSEVILSATYQTATDGLIEIDVREVVESNLSFLLQDVSTPYNQMNLVATFTATIDDSSINFRVIRSGVNNLSTEPINFLQANFLTWQPQLKYVTYSLPEYLTYYAISPCLIKVKAYFTDDFGVTTDDTKQIGFIPAGSAYTIPVQYAVVSKLFNSLLPSFYDVWVEDNSGTRLSYIQRYVASDMLSEEEQWILFENSLGGVDTFRAYGQTSLSGDHTHNVAEVDEIASEYRVDTERKYTKSTGFLGNYERKWLLDFFPSLHKFVYSGLSLRQIVVTESNVGSTDKEAVSEYSFTYKFSDAKPYLNLERTTELQDNLTIKVPDLGSFSVPPRLVEFPSLPLSVGALFPVQSPFSEEWSTTTISAIFNYVIDRISIEQGSGIGHTHTNLDLLQVLSYVNDYLLINGEKLKAGTADSLSAEGAKNFVRKDIPETLVHLLKLRKGAEFGEYFDSLLSGKGTGIDANGRIQTDYIEVRKAMTVMSLIINEIQGMSSDFVFSDVGTVQSVTQIEEGVYRLIIDKQHDNELLKFDENYVCKQVVNSLVIGGTDYYTSWFRVISKNVNDNAITVVLYPDSEVPGGHNFPPVADYNIQRIGHSDIISSEEYNPMAAYWTISSREGRIQFLQNVFKPILEDYNYALSIGKIPKLDALKNLPINDGDVGIVAETIVTQNFYQYDYNGDIKTNVVDRGEWSIETAMSDSPYRNVQHEAVYPDGKTTYTLLEQHTVYYLGCKWGCLIDKTTDSPAVFSPAWQMLEGDKNYSVQFESSTGSFAFRANNINADITARIYYGNIDVTDMVMNMEGVEVEWLRDTGNIPSDNSWKPTYSDSKNVLRLKTADLGSGWCINYWSAKFTFVAHMPVGDGYEQITDFIGFNI